MSKVLKLSLIGLDKKQREQVLNLARCLEGSTTSHQNQTHQPEDFIGVFSTNFLVYEPYTAESGHNGYYPVKELVFDIETIKLNPWRCAEFSVRVKIYNGDEHMCTYGWLQRVRMIQFINKVTYNPTYKLCLDNLPKGVEVCDG